MQEVYAKNAIHEGAEGWRERQHGESSNRLAETGRPVYRQYRHERGPGDRQEFAPLLLGARIVSDGLEDLPSNERELRSGVHQEMEVRARRS